MQRVKKLVKLMFMEIRQYMNMMKLDITSRQQMVREISQLMNMLVIILSNQ